MTGSEVAPPQATATTTSGRPASGPGTDQRRERVTRLLDGIRSGDRDAISELVRTLSPLLWSVARAQGLDRDAAEDAVQNTWLHLLRSADGIQSPQALTSWLVTVTRREAIRLAVSEGRQRATDPAALPDLASPEPYPEELATGKEHYQRLWSSVQQLPAKCRSLLRIVALVDRPDYAAVSDALGMPKGSIGPTRGRCLAKLRQLLESDPAWSGL